MKTLKLINNRLAIILPLCTDKSVLDAGCGGDGCKSKNWLHGEICRVSASTLGVDINQDVVNEIEQRGYKVMQGNAETISTGKKFEVITACELIEHLSNPGLFLENMKLHLFDNGILIITTPNRFYATLFLSYFIRNRISHNIKPYPLHVHFYDVHSLKVLVNRHGYDIVELYYSTSNDGSVIGKFASWFISKFRPDFAERIIAILKVR